MALKNYQPITVRPPQAIRPELEQLAADLGKSEGQILSEVVADCVEMLKAGQDFVPKVVRAARALRAHGATFSADPHRIAEKRDRLEVSLYDSIQAGRSTGICCDDPPARISLPTSVSERVDFAVRICGDSMTPIVREGEIGLFRKSEEGIDGRLVAAAVDGQVVLKVLQIGLKGRRELVSLNKKYEPIPVTADTRIQGLYVGKLPASYLAEEKERKRHEREMAVAEEGPAPF